ncbi:MAG TPA: type II/IV secretion system protein [Dehalococcoidia bacterium]|jgi:general secretion pathway protein E|nr:type II/IV secretion system protein [Dehalococcoidia bacterium]
MEGKKATKKASSTKPAAPDLGEMLLEAQLITPKQLEQAQELAQRQGRRLRDVLVEQGFVKSEDLVAVLSVQMNVPFIDLKRHTLQPEALKLVKEWTARKYNLVPLDIVEDELVVVMADPQDIQAINEVVAQSGYRVRPTIGIPEDICEAIDLNYQTVGEIEQEIKRLSLPTAKAEPREGEIALDIVEGAPIVRVVDLLIQQAIRGRASDIHIEPQKDRLRVRYRIDGVLHDFMPLPLEIHPALVSRIKILAGMNIAERRLPQDGQLSFSADGREVDIRAATSETAYGEMVVLRILDKSRFILDLTQLGMLPEALQRYQKLLTSPHGLILVAGPTGAGKTTTLYASLNELDRKGKNIVTIEEPIEYYFDDINQIQVNYKAGITFASGLKAIMRLDPDIILVGEMRDADTASTGIQAALTGHLVLSSIHGNDAAAVFLRLANLGVDPFLMSSAILGVVAQRMVRRICPHCRALGEIPPEQRLAYEEEMGEPREKFYYGAGCNFCSQTGYLGRTGVFELLVMSDQIRQMLLSGASTTEIREQAIKEGMVTMLRDGMLKVKEGITTPSEVLYNVFSLR